MNVNIMNLMVISYFLNDRKLIIFNLFSFFNTFLVLICIQ